MSTHPTRVVIADDESLVRAGLYAIVDAEPDLTVVGEAATGAQAVERVRELRPDVVLMDVRMPDLNGIEATARILREVSDPSPRVLVVTTFENDEYVYDALRAGAHGFLLKRARADDMVHAIRTVARGDSLLFPAAIRDLALTRARERTHNAELRTRVARLTPREQEVLRLITTGLANTEIAERTGLGPETVKTHVARVLTKLGVRDRTQAVIAAYESGFTGTGLGGWA
ncbi:response regulator transcription factor [Embleya hyalina]|uniref:DNA-binding response regulator n=1 Tax=Embleya hyalina TaxID=516124 RepID=A0A401Z0V0_9ACTN|nr:response regulator transcription factor [Embleya hyalina]GCE00462.1 DNA-binding response regulator [Embleya hyalina]